MKSSFITEGILSLLFIVQALAIAPDCEYGVWRACPGWWCPKTTCCSVPPSPYCPGAGCCTSVPSPLSGCSCCLPDYYGCCPYAGGKTTTCTTVPHSAPLYAKTTTCTTVPHPVCGKTTTCTTVPHAAPCCSKTTACTTVPHFLPPPPVVDPCGKTTTCTTVPTPCGPKTTCCTVPSYYQYPCGCGPLPCGNPPCGCCSWC